MTGKGPAIPEDEMNPSPEWTSVRVCKEAEAEHTGNIPETGRAERVKLKSTGDKNLAGELWL